MELSQAARETGKLATKISAAANAPHAGSCLSVSDILAAIYFGPLGDRLTPAKFGAPDAPRVILSKGHAVAALYAVLHLKGFLTRAQLDSFHQNGGLPGHADTSAPGVEFSTGSLGHGLAVGAGLALANRLAKVDAPVFVVMGDGECQEGAVWEAANFAAANQLPGLVAVIDANAWQAYDPVAKLAAGTLEGKWRAAGWKVSVADGHDPKTLSKVLARAAKTKSPIAVIARTVKGRGLGALEGTLESHYRTPKGDEFDDV